MMKRFIGFLVFVSVVCLCSDVWSADFYVGCKSVDFTPDRPVYLHGQMYTRISEGVETPLTANIVALESRDGKKQLDSVIIVSLDLCWVTKNIYEGIVKALKRELPDFNPDKLILAATHTHTSISTNPNSFFSNRKDILEGDEAAEFVVTKVVPGIVSAWKSRVKGKMAFGLGFADVASNRRAVYNDGKAVMYGSTKTPDFRSVEGIEDHDVNSMFFWDEKDKLLGMIINVSCPSQVVEGRMKINADYWHPVREVIHAKYGKDVCVAGLCGAAGDMAPRPQFLQVAEERMATLRNMDRMEELARRITRAVDETYTAVEKTKTDNVPLFHRYAILDLPQQKVTKELADQFQKQADDYKAQIEKNKDGGSNGPYVFYHWTKQVVDRYNAQKGVENPTYPIPVHVLRIGQTAMCTNPFELYTDFGIEMKARSRALQTFVVQLTDQRSIGGYVPSEYATRGGGYGAIPQSNNIGAEGGHVLVEKSLEMLNPLFDQK